MGGGKIEREYPRLCQRCGKRYSVEDNREFFYCGLMAEAMRDGVPVWSCAHFTPTVDILKRTVDCTPPNERHLRGVY